MNAIQKTLITLLAAGLSACVSTPPPRDMDNVCHIFKQYPKWYQHARDVEKRWLVPVPVQMAIIHQESHFDATARPIRSKLLGFIPWKRASSAYGYAQALDGTWALYKQRNGGLFSSRNDFSDGVDFIGWYANDAYKRAHISRSDANKLYLAYHEGVGGYMRQTYRQKPWLIRVAHKVAARAQIYKAQLQRCEQDFKSRWFK